MDKTHVCPLRQRAGADTLSVRAVLGSHHGRAHGEIGFSVIARRTRSHDHRLSPPSDA
jgi:hypothetical protein